MDTFSNYLTNFDFKNYVDCTANFIFRGIFDDGEISLLLNTIFFKSYTHLKKMVEEFYPTDLYQNLLINVIIPNCRSLVRFVAKSVY